MFGDLCSNGEEYGSRLRIPASLLTRGATFNLSCLHFFICKMCSGPYLNRAIVYINKSTYVRQLEESQAQSTRYLFKYLSAIMLIRQALTKDNLVAACACYYINQIQIAQAWGACACGGHELENFPPSLRFFLLYLGEHVPEMFWRNFN